MDITNPPMTTPVTPTNPISLDNPPSDTGKIDLQFAEPRAALSAKQLTQRATKAGIALDEDPQALTTEMADAQGEAQVRQRAVYKDNLEFREAKRQYLDEVLKTRDPSKPMSMEEAGFIMSLSREEFTPQNPEALEKLYSQKIMQRLYGRPDNPVYTKALETNPEASNAIQDAAEQNLQRWEWIQKKYEDTQRSYDQSTGVFGHIWNMGEQMIPLKSTLTKYDSVVSGMSPGENLASQGRYYWMMPPEKFIAEVSKTFDEIAAHNPLDAHDWLASIMSYGRMSQNMDNLWFGVDVASILPVGTLGKLAKGAEKAAKATEKVAEGATKASAGWLKEVVENLKKSPDIDEGSLARWADDGGPVPDELQAAKAARDTQAALMKNEQRLEETLAKSGHQEEAVDVSVQKRIAADEAPAPDVRDPSEFINLSNTRDSMYNPRAWLQGGSQLAREATDRIMNGVNTAKLKFTEAIAEPGQAIRLTGEAMAKAVELAKRRMRHEFVHIDDSIIDTRWRVVEQADNPDTQINEVVMTLGEVGASAFKKAEDAQQVAEHLYKLRKGDYTVRPEGSEFYIEVRRPVDERDASVAQAMITTNNETPKSFVNMLLGWFRNPDDLLSQFSRENRKAVTGSGNIVQNYFSEAIKPISQLSGRQKDRLSNMMDINRNNLAPDGRRGFWYNSVGEYEQAYYDVYKQYPTESEIQAYMITREISDFDWSVRSLTILRGKSEKAITNVHFKFPKREAGDQAAYEAEAAQWMDDGGAVGRAPDRIVQADGQFEGKLLDHLPDGSQGDAGVYIVKEGEGSGEWKTLKSVDREEVRKLLEEQGYKVYQQADGMNNPFADVDGKTLDRAFIIMKNAQTSALRAEDMLPYRAGYHVRYAPGFYTKMGRFFRDGTGKLVYGGDTSIMYHVSEAAAKKYTQAFDKARQLLKDQKVDELKAFLPRELPHTYEQFVKLYSDGTLDVNVPVQYTRSGGSTRDSIRAGQTGSSEYDLARDAYNSPYNLSADVNRQFAQEKDIALPSVVRGSEGEPLYKFEPAKQINPMASLSRSMHEMTKMRVYDNYQKQSIMSLVEEFANPSTIGGSVTKRSLESVRNNPLAFIADPLWDTKTLSRDKLAAAKNAHRAIVNLLGVQSEVSKNIDWAMNRVVDTIFEKFGDGAASKAADFMATKLKDPTKYARYVAFHTKLGLFNPVQLILQMQSVVHGAAMTGNLKRSYQAMGAGMLMRYLSLATDEGIIKSFAKKARAFGWTEDEFLESFTNMKAAGIWHVEGEVADLNDVFSANMFQGAGKRFLNKGTIFFQEGERFVRLNAWNTAYKEWKAANPTKILGNRERNEILRRYDDLAINMTRSSTGAWQQGILSVPAQFSTYQIHLAEQLLGKRLTNAEKARVVATYSALYGVPTGIAAGTALWPWGQDIKQAALERGIEINDGVIDVLMNGIMAAGIETVTGREYSLSERYGPNGITIFKEALNGQKSLLDLITGPSGQIVGDILGAADPVASDLLDIFTGDNSKVPLLADDLVEGLRNVSTINNFAQMFYAMNAGKFMSKNELFTTKADSFDGVMKGIFGLDPRSIADTYVKIESMKEFRQFQDDAKKEFVKNYRRMLQNYENKSARDMYDREAKKWFIYGGFRPDQAKDLVDAAIDGDISLVEKIERQYELKGPTSPLNAKE